MRKMEEAMAEHERKEREEKEKEERVNLMLKVRYWLGFSFQLEEAILLHPDSCSGGPREKGEDGG